MTTVDVSVLLAGVRARVDAATEGPWLTHRSKHVPGRYVAVPGGETLIHATETWAKPADAEFIAAARSDVPRLLDALEAVLKLADEIHERSPHSVRDHTASDFRAVIADALTTKEKP